MKKSCEIVIFGNQFQNQGEKPFNLKPKMR